MYHYDDCAQINEHRPVGEFPPLVRVQRGQNSNVANDVPLFPGTSFLCFTNNLPEGTLEAELIAAFSVNGSVVAAHRVGAGRFGCISIDNGSQNTFSGNLELRCPSGNCNGAITMMSCYYENMDQMLQSRGIDPLSLSNVCAFCSIS